MAEARLMKTMCVLVKPAETVYGTCRMRECDRSRARPRGSKGSDDGALAELELDGIVGVRRRRMDVEGNPRRGDGPTVSVVMHARYAALANPECWSRDAVEISVGARASSQSRKRFLSVETRVAAVRIADSLKSVEITAAYIAEMQAFCSLESSGNLTMSQPASKDRSGAWMLH